MLRRWTWKQVQLAAECIAQYEIDRLNMIVEPLLAAFDIEYKPGEVETKGRTRKGKPAKKRPTDIDYSDAEAVARAEKRDAALLGAFKGMGVQIREDP